MSRVLDKNAKLMERKCKMDLSNEGDDFFGADEEPTDQRSHDRNDIVGSKWDAGFQAADVNAERRRFRTLGFHEEYDSSREERLQSGFQDGYSSTYEEAHRIGEFIGSAVMQSKVYELLANSDKSQYQERDSSKQVAASIAKAVRAFVAIPDNHGHLSHLESQIQKIMLEKPTCKASDNDA